MAGMSRAALLLAFAILSTSVCLEPSTAQAPASPNAATQPWMNKSLAPERRAELVLKEMTLDEKIGLLHGEGMAGWQHMSASIRARAQFSNGGAGWVLGVPRLGLPSIQQSDAAYGVRSSAMNGRYSTALPSNVGSAASWDPEAACAYGTLIGQELRAQGYNMTLGGGVNLNRDPRNGRTFEYMGEDPVLAGTLVGARIRCEGAQHVISDIKHYALNDQESGRQEIDVHVSERAARESDLLAFEIGVRDGQPKAVMCSYNGVNGVYACENPWLLTEVLKKEWKFPGFVLSDWAATHSTVAASAAGLDQEQPLDEFYGEALQQAVASGKVPMSELDDHVRRVLYAEFASGIVDDPAVKSVVDVRKGFDVARRIEEQSAVLLKNEAHALPLDRASLKSVAVIGMHADTGMISGGGSAQVDPPGEMAGRHWKAHVWFPTSPLNAMKAKAPGAQFSFASGENVAEAVAAAERAQVAVVFAWQWSSEDYDQPSLSLPDGQDKLIAAVAAANPRTIVVLETSSAVMMPWLNKTPAVVEAWFAGSSGADAVANVLFGDVNPSGKLPITFPMSEDDLPRKAIQGPPAPVVNGKLSFTVDYNIEGAAVGYKWFETQKRAVLFPFGFGLSYTTFQYAGLRMSADGSEAMLTLTNTGARKGSEIAEVYATLPDAAGEPWKRLVGWQKVELDAGEKRELKIRLEPLGMSVWDAAAKTWERPKGVYRVEAGPSSAELPLKGTFAMR
jgi:beta-glucosidase